MAAEQEGKIEVEVEGEGPSEVEIVDDRPEADKNATPLKADPSDIPDDEIKQYSENVKKRIQHLKHGYHDERRAKEEAFREREAAIAYAKQIAEENSKLKEKLSTGETTLIKTMQLQLRVDHGSRSTMWCCATGAASTGSVDVRIAKVL